MAGRLHDPLRALLASAGVLAPGEPAPSRDEVARRLRAAGWSASNIQRVLGPDPKAPAEPAREREPEAKAALVRVVPPRTTSGQVPAAAPQRSLAEPATSAGTGRTRGDALPAPRGPAASASAAAAPLPREPRARLVAWKSPAQLDAERRAAPPPPPSGPRLALLPAPLPILPPAPGLLGGRGEQRDCARWDECVTMLALREPNAPAGYCHPGCTAFVDPRPADRAFATAQRGPSSWEAAQ